MLEYVDNYDKYFSFLFKGEDIKKYKNKKIKEIIIQEFSHICAITNKNFK